MILKLLLFTRILIRPVFGPLKGNDYPNEQAVDSHGIGQNDDMVSLLREHLGVVSPNPIKFR